jgi:hypothetical protein
VRLADRAHRVGREVRARLYQVELTVAPDELVDRQVVVDVRQVDVEDLVAEERQRAKGIERVGRDHADDFAMRGDGVHRAIERRERVVGEQEPQARIEACRARLVDRLEAIQPQPRPGARADADLEREDLGG